MFEIGRKRFIIVQIYVEEKYMHRFPCLNHSDKSGRKFHVNFDKHVPDIYLTWPSRFFLFLRRPRKGKPF